MRDENNIMYNKIAYSAVLVTIGFLSWEDIKKKEISLFVLIVSGSIALLCLIAENGIEIVHIVGCMLPGMLLLALSLISQEKIGYGDGATVLVLGFWTDMDFCVATLAIAFLLTGCYAIFLLLKRRKDEKIPFIPFLLAAMEVLFLNA